jgi:hypothetical protein
VAGTGKVAARFAVGSAAFDKQKPIRLFGVDAAHRHQRGAFPRSDRDKRSDASRSCSRTNVTGPEQRTLRRRPKQMKSTRGKPAEGRQSNTGCALQTCVMLANASIQNITTLQGLPLCAALDDTSPLRRVPAADCRFRGDDARWLGTSRFSSCFAASPKENRPTTNGLRKFLEETPAASISGPDGTLVVRRSPCASQPLRSRVDRFSGGRSAWAQFEMRGRVRCRAARPLWPRQ